MYEVLLERRAERDLKRLPPEVFDRIVLEIKALAQTPRPPGCRKLEGSKRDWRIRIADYRVLYEIAMTNPRPSESGGPTQDDAIRSFALVSFTKSWRRLAQVESGRLRGAFPYEDSLVLATRAYCPNDPNTQGQMAVFLTRTFNLP